MLTKKVNGVEVTLTAAEEAEVRAEWASEDAAKAQAQADAEARQAQRDARLEAVPANEQSIIALRDKVNMILAELRGA